MLINERLYMPSISFNIFEIKRMPYTSLFHLHTMLPKLLLIAQLFLKKNFNLENYQYGVHI